MRNVRVATAFLLLAACSAELPHDAPFDPNAPASKQAKGQVSGKILLENETDHSQVSVQLQNAERTYTVDSQKDGSVKLTGVVPGEYTLTIGTRYFESQSEKLTVDIAEEVSLAPRTLAPLRGRVLGLATSESIQGSSLVTTGGVSLSLKKTASVRVAVASAPAFGAAAATATGATLRALSGSDGNYEFGEVPAGGYRLYASTTETGERVVGDVTVTGEGDITVDPIVLRPLTGYFEILGTANGVPSSTYTSVPNVNLQLQQSNAAQVKVAVVDVATDGTTAGCDLSTAARQALPSNTLLPLRFTTEGKKLVCVSYVDADGKETEPIYGSIISDATPPILSSVQINGGSSVVSSNIVTLQLSAVDTLSGVANYKVQLSNAFTGSGKPYQPTDVFTLTTVDGVQTVWVVFADHAGNYAAPVSATVRLDTAAPVPGGVSLTKLDGTPLSTGATIADSGVKLVSTVNDDTMLEMQVSINAGVTWQPWGAYDSDRVIDLPSGTSSLGVRVRDQAGHVVDIISAFVVTTDTTPPSGTLDIAPTAVTSTAITVQATGSGDAVGVELAFDPGFVTSLGLFTPGPIPVNLPTGDGTKTVYGRFFDAAGNASALVGDTVVLDTTEPLILSFSIAATNPTRTNPVDVLYSASGATDLRIIEGADCGGSREPIGSGTRIFTLGASEGMKTIRLQFFDAAGNASVCAVRTIYFDPNPPLVGTMLINYGQAATSSNTATISFAGVSGATKVMISEDPDFDGVLWDGYAATKTVTLSNVNGVKTLYAKVADDAEHVVNLPQATITLDTTPPTTPSIFAAFDVTTATSVPLTLSVGLVSEMWLTQGDPNFTTGGWETYSGSKLFSLSGTDGTKTIYAKFKKSTGLETNVVSDTVVLDRTAPILPSVLINGGAVVVTSNIVTLSLSAVDTASGLAAYKVNTLNDFSAMSPKPYQPTDVFTLSPGDGFITVWVILGDRAGLYSPPVSASVLVDSTPPSAGGAVTLTKLDGTPLTTGGILGENRVVLTSSVSDASALQMQVTTNGSYTGVAWVPYEPNKVIDLTSGTPSISARVRDGAGLILDLVTAFTLTIDTTAPVLTFNRTSSSPTRDLTVTLALAPSETSQAQVSENSAFDGANWFPAANTSVVLTAGDGVRTIYARARDTAGNVSTVRTVTVQIDQTPPQLAAFTINGAAAYTNNSAVTLSFSGIDINQYRPAEGTCSGTYATHAGSATFNLAGQGLRTVAVQFRDAVGNETTCITRTITLDSVVPTVASFKINNDAAFTTNRVVSLSIGATDASEMQVSEASDFTGASWTPVTSTTSFVLSTGEDVKTVYARFRDPAGNSTQLSDTISVDTLAPAFNAVTGPSITNNRILPLYLSATGAGELQLSENPDFSGASWKPYAASTTHYLSAAAGGKTIYARLRDTAQNLSFTLTHGVTLDQSGPSAPTITLLGGAYTKTETISIQIAVEADFVMLSESSIFSGATWLPHSLVKSFTLSSVDGLKTIYVKVKDAAGNESGSYSLTVTLDKTLPSVSLADVQTTGGVSIADGATTNQSRVVVVSTVSDVNSLEMQISTTGSYVGAIWEPYAASRVLDLALPSAVAGESRGILARVRDAAGNISDIFVSRDLVLDTIAPSAPSLIVSGDIAGAVSSTTVNVTLSAGGSPVNAEIAYDPGFVTSLGSFAPTGTHAVTLAAGDGAKSLYVRFFDAAGNISALAGDTVILDRTPPDPASFSIANTSPTRTNPLTLTYAASGAAEFRTTEHATLCGGAREPLGDGTKAFTVTASEGTKSVRMQFFDAVGNASACLLKTVYYDPNPPVVGSFQINYGQAATSSNVVTISFTGVSGASRVIISEDAGFAGADWSAYAVTKTLVLSAGNGVKTVYAKVADDAGHIVALTQKTITLDTTPPTDPAIFAAYDVTRTTSVQLTLSAGLVADMWIIQGDPTFSTGAWETYTGSKAFPLTGTDGTKAIYAKFRKSTGVETATVSDTVILDRTAPILPEVRVNNGVSVVSSSVVTLNLSAVDTASGLYTYKVNTINDFSALSPKPYQTTDVFSFAGGDGLKAVWVTFGDRAGLYSPPVSTVVFLDQTAPSVTSSLLKLGDASTITVGQTICESRVYLVTVASDLTPLEMQVTTNGSFTGVAWEPYSANKVIDLALPAGQTAELRNVQARLRDGAGQVVSLINLDVMLDTRAPSGTMTLTSPALTNNASISVSLSSNEAPNQAQVSSDPSFTSAVWFATVNTTYTLPAGDGVRTVYARFRDGAGNLSSSMTVSLTLDQTVPALPSVSIASGASTVNNPTGGVTLDLSAVDAGSGILKMKIANLTSGACAAALGAVSEENFAAGTAWTLAGPGAGVEGTRTVCAGLRDGAGNWSVPVSDTVAYDTKAPTIFAGGMLINGGDLYTTETFAELALSATGATEMMIANGLSFGGSAWETYRTLTSWFLAPSDTPVDRIVSVKFRDAAGNESAMYSDAVTLDTGAPSSPVISINNGAPYAITTSVDLDLFAVGADKVRLSNDPLFTPYIEFPYASVVNNWALAAGDGSKTVYAQFFDVAGNASSIVSEHLTLDTAPPSGADFEIEDSPVTPLLSVFLNLTATDAAQMQISEGGCVGTWSAFSANASYDFASSLDEEKYISVRFRDEAGNMTACITKSITLDTSAPYVTSIAPRSGEQGKTVVINGLNFGSVAGTVTIGGLNCTISGTWTNSQVSVIVPTNVDPGTQDLILTAGGKVAKPVKFNVLIIVSTLLPLRAALGQSITITGVGFGLSGALYFDSVSVPTTSWTRTSIVAQVPALQAGGYSIQIASNDAFSLPEPFILRPLLTSMTPVTGPVGTTITLNGTAFGSSQADSQVFIGARPVTVTTWTNTNISAVVPYSLVSGAQRVDIAVNNASSLPATFTVTDSKPLIRSVTPLSQVIGKSVTLAGVNFGASQGTATYDGLSATVTGWYPNVVTITVPAGASGTALVRVQTAALEVSNTEFAQVRAVNSWNPNSWIFESRYYAVAVWTGTEMLVYGGCCDATPTDHYTGAKYNPTLDTWTPIASGGALATGRKAVWTGTEMFIFNGTSSYRFNPATNVWTSAGTGAPAYATGHALVWTGSKIITWGGQYTNVGGIYNPQTNTWTSTSTVGAPIGRRYMAYAWTGTEMLIWGGRQSGSVLPNDGARFDPVLNQWQSLPVSPLTGREQMVSAWTGGELIIWGGTGGASGARFNPKTNLWKTLSTTSSPGNRYSDASIVWTGTELIIWGGSGGTASSTGARYSPTSNVWTTMGGSPPTSRQAHSTVWTGTEMIVWGGLNSSAVEQYNGGRYNPVTNIWTAIQDAPQTLSSGVSGAKLWSGSELLQWNGSAGERIDPATNRVVAMGTSGAPANSGGAGTWSGTRAYFWGNSAGGIYNPATNSWTAMSTTNQPSSSGGHFMYWNAVTSNAIVFGGGSFSGAMYFPLTNTWQTMTTAGAPPTTRSSYSTVWTGNHIIVFGGKSGISTEYKDGFKWAQSATGGTWAPIADALGYRYDHAAVWAGTKMYVIGGWTSVGFCGSASSMAYEPATNTWTSESTGFGRMRPAVAWNGTYIFQWGGSFDGTTCGNAYGGGRVYNPATGISTAISTVGSIPGGTGLTALGAGDEFFMWNGANMYRYMPP